MFIYDVFIRPRVDSPSMTFQPFSGKLFDIDPAKVWGINIKKSGSYDLHKLRTREDLEWAAEILNSFRYSYWTPEFREEKDRLPAGNNSALIAFGEEGEEGAIVHFFTRDSIFVGNVWYHCDTSQFDELFNRF